MQDAGLAASPLVYRADKRLVAEMLGTGLLVAVVIGSGIMAERLAAGNMAVALLANAVATGAALIVLITVFGPISGAHLNPAVSVAFAIRRQLPPSLLAAYVMAQVVGACCGAILAHAMFDLPLIQMSGHMRGSGAQAISEAVATFGLLLTIFGALAFRPSAVPVLVGLYIVAAYWFTASTSFANPAVTLARSLTDTFAGIAPASVPIFVGAQIAGGGAALFLSHWLLTEDRPHA